MELVTIPSVPICRTGTYELASGPRTFTEEDLQAAADALANDPAVTFPRIKIDGLSESFDPEAHGGEPAFGWADNLTVSADGQELTADFHVPDWLAASMTWAYPSLSIEGPPPGWTSATGRSYGLVVTAVAMLGVDWPGVATLQDLRQLLASGPALQEEPEEAGVVARTAQRPTSVAASLDSDLVARRFYDLLDGGSMELPEGVVTFDVWIRSMRFDDAGQPYLKVTDEASGRLFRVDFTVSGSEVSYGAWSEVVEQDVPVAAAARPAAPLAQWGTRELARAVRAESGTNEEESHVTDEQRRAMALALGLPETATEEEVHAAAAAAAESGQNENEGGGEGAGGDGEGDGEGSGSEQQPVAAAGAVPEGAVLIDAGELARLQQGTATAERLAGDADEAERDRLIEAAIGEGRFGRARTEHYRASWAADRDGTRILLTAPVEQGGLAPNTVPVSARGVAPQAESAASEAAEHDAFMASKFPNVRARQRGDGRGVRHRTEV